MSSILSDIDVNLNQVDAWMLKQEFDEFKNYTDKVIHEFKNYTDKVIHELDVQLNSANKRIDELDAFIRYLEYEILELKKDVNI